MLLFFKSEGQTWQFKSFASLLHRALWLFLHILSPDTDFLNFKEPRVENLSPAMGRGSIPGTESGTE